MMKIVGVLLICILPPFKAENCVGDPSAEKVILDPLLSLLQVAQELPLTAHKHESVQDLKDISKLDLRETARASPRHHVKQEPIGGVPGEDPPAGNAKNSSIFYAFILLICIFTIVWAYSKLRKAYGQLADCDNGYTFREYLDYRFGNWFDWTDFSKEKVLAALCVCYLIIVSLVYCLTVKSTIMAAMYNAFNMLVDPGGAQAQNTSAGQLLGIPASLGGLIIFAVLLAVVQDRFGAYLESIKLGTAPVVESGHILIVGFTADTKELIAELCLGCKAKAKEKNVIVVLAQDEKQTVEDSLADLERYGSEIVVRTGVPHQTDDLQRVSANTCSVCILMPDREYSVELRDAFIMQTVIALSSKGWPASGRILLTCSVARNEELFKSLGGNGSDVVLSRKYITTFLNECSIQPGFGSILHSLLGFKDSEFYVVDTPTHLLGKTMGEASRYYPSSILLGVMVNGNTRLCPGVDYKISSDDQLIILTHDEETSAAALTPYKPETPMRSDGWPTEAPRSVAEERKSPKTEIILVLGCNHLLGNLLHEIDKSVAPGTKIITYSPGDVEERKEQVRLDGLRLQRELQNIDADIEYQVGELGNRGQLEELISGSAKDADRIFVLSDNRFPETSVADAITVTSLVQIHDALEKRANSSSTGRAKMPTLVPQLRNNSSEDLCKSLGYSDFVNSTRVPAQMMANFALEPRVMPVILDLLKEDSAANNLIKPISVYLPPGEAAPPKVNFWELSNMVQRTGDVLAGWTYHNDCSLTQQKLDRGPSQMGKGVELRPDPVRTSFELNPEDKETNRDWSEEYDRLIVFSHLPQ